MTDTSNTPLITPLETLSITRRRFLTGLAATSLALTAAPSFAAGRSAVKTLSFYNLHTGERLKTDYCENGKYCGVALREINHILRDHRTNQVHPIDPMLLDKLVVLQRRLGSRSPFEIISGYRSPKTNHMLHEASRGVASKSQHVLGKAVDIRLNDRSLNEVHKAALAMGGGGVGYYPKSDFVHIDTGPARSWG